MNPNGAGSPSLVYDASPADYGRFLCGLSLPPPAGIGSCATLGSVKAQDLNLASITAASVIAQITIPRSVTNVSGVTSTFLATAALDGYTVAVAPSSLTLAPGATGNFTVTLTRTTAPLGTWAFGSLTWSDGVKNVVSPLNARSLGFSAPAQITDVRTSGSGSKVVPVVSSYTGTLAVSPVGLVPATRNTNSIATGLTQCYNVAVPAGAQVARFQLFNADTSVAADLDLNVFNGPSGTGTNVGSSAGGSSDEVVTLAAPAAGTYSACVTAFAAASGVTYTMSNWVVGPAVGTQTLRASAPTNVFAGGGASVGLGWNVPAGARYLGNLTYIDTRVAGSPVTLGSSIVFVDNH